MLVRLSERMLTWLAVLVSTAAMRAVAGELVIHVGTNGCDEWSGRLPSPRRDRTDGPVASLPAALARVEQWPAGRAATIRLGPGVFVVSNPIRIGPQHSGTREHPLVIRGEPGGRTILRGSRPVTNWSRGTGSVWVADLKSSDVETGWFRQVFYRGERMTLARWPNFDPDNPYAGGWAEVDGQPIPMYRDVPADRRDEFQYRDSDAAHWRDWAGAEVVVFPRYNWWNNILPVVSVDPDQRRVRLRHPASYAIRPGDRYYVRGTRSALDAPGEWWHEAAKRRLWFIPPDGRSRSRSGCR